MTIEREIQPFGNMFSPGAQSDLTEFFELDMRPRAFVPINVLLSLRYFLERKPSGIPIEY
jgi:hypothetical protein